jgi:predicted enzyme related to lactoylglutathione lyase
MENDKAHFSHLKLVVDDLEGCAAFYAAVCGLTEFGRASATMNGRPATEVMFAPSAEGAAMFVLVKFHDTPRRHGNDVLLGFQTSDLEAFCSRVTSAGGQVTQPITSIPEHGVKAAFVTDVEGNVLEVLQLL